MSASGKSNIVAALATTHTPPLGTRMGEVQPAQAKRILEGFAAVSEEIAKAKPDVAIVFVNDHWDLFTLQNMPGFAIAYGDTHWGPREDAQAWVGMTRQSIPGHSALAQALISSLTEDGFEIFRFPTAEVGHNVLMPKKYMWPNTDIAVVPIFINCFGPPLPTWRRSYEMGRAVRRAIEGRPERIALIASGGLSHYPPLTNFEVDEDHWFHDKILTLMTHGRQARVMDPLLGKALHDREMEMVAEGRSFVNEQWDRDVMQRLADADVDYITAIKNDEAMHDAGEGASEVMMWAALMGAMNDAKADMVMYENVPEWRAAVALMSYARSIAAGA